MTKKASIQRPYPPPVANIDELSYQTGLALSTIRLYVKNGWLPPAYPCGNKRLWIMSDVMAHIANQGKMEENGKTHPDNEDLDEYEEGLKRVAPAKKTHDRAA